MFCYRTNDNILWLTYAAMELGVRILGLYATRRFVDTNSTSSPWTRHALELNQSCLSAMIWCCYDLRQSIPIAYCWSTHPLQQNTISDDKILPMSVHRDHETSHGGHAPFYKAVDPVPFPCFAIGRSCSLTACNTTAVALNLLVL